MRTFLLSAVLALAVLGSVALSPAEANPWRGYRYSPGVYNRYVYGYYPGVYNQFSYGYYPGYYNPYAYGYYPTYYRTGTWSLSNYVLPFRGNYYYSPVYGYYQY
jgi:hypothetical protein